MDRIIFTFGDLPITAEMLAYAGAALFAVLLTSTLVLVARQARERRAEAEQRALEMEAAKAKNLELETKLASMLQGQYEMTSRMQTMSEIFGSRTTDLMRSLNERLDAQGQRVGQALTETNNKTAESLSKLNERLAVIDRAQGTITQLSSQVVTLQSILSNKQTRGAFGQGRMEAIITDQLPPGAFAFQYTLSNGKRPDCVVFMPNGGPKLVVDAKFPLESYHALQAAADDVAKKTAERAFRDAMNVHIKAISERYIVPGETADAALMFLPSEAVYAELHGNFTAVVEESYRARVFIVSPTTLWATLNTVRAILKDVRMKEQAGLIQKEVQILLGDVVRLDDRVGKMQRHFDQAGEDMRQIRISTDKVGKRAERIESVQLEDDAKVEVSTEITEDTAPAAIPLPLRADGEN